MLQSTVTQEQLFAHSPVCHTHYLQPYKPSSGQEPSHNEALLPWELCTCNWDQDLAIPMLSWPNKHNPRSINSYRCRQTRPQQNFPAGRSSQSSCLPFTRTLTSRTPGKSVCSHHLSAATSTGSSLWSCHAKAHSATSLPQRKRCPLAGRCPGAAETTASVLLKEKHSHQSLTAQRFCSPSSTGLTETPAQAGAPSPLREGSWVLPFPPGS